ncbi:4-alpha-glucanotransferase [Dethiosulfovibrio peptidovorans DSM 11002]|uniref:4-alpha-glucanotransferase n=1 Tax=Dethiosulfovibrio peptidovorans DSM 11002 TaxID=469381 RepID=D2Z4H5_9BACT|nr:4-alpha-glucanotransferase [Dethiosulfovibrio peptidovorans]EFC90504.1 4-alpha-glucanotransferase [Dethiosulfovibrio peptidovorans DSM 11002]
MRRSALLLHISSLPSPWGVGDMGPEAHRLVRSLVRQGLDWQTLPMNETSAVFGHSPYSPISAFAGNRLFISPELMAEDGWIDESDLPPKLPIGPANFEEALKIREVLLEKAWQKNREDMGFSLFKESERHWLEDYCLFRSLKRRFSMEPWHRWPEPYRIRDESAMTEISEELNDEMDLLAFGQYIFFRQQRTLHRLCADEGLELIGDMPIYVIHDSPDVWAHPKLFQLDKDLRPSAVAGVPPDYYSEDGQLWGNPLYDWDRHLLDEFGWWMSRLKHALELYDKIRIDHFRGLVGYWSVPADETTAKKGNWVETPSESFFETLRTNFPTMPFLAEDLGVITPDVKETMEYLDIPGMAVLQFAFDGDTGSSPYTPHNHVPSMAVYTGTHDNDTTAGWFSKLEEDSLNRLESYIGRKLDEKSALEALIRMALGSVAELAVVPAQDLLELGTEARMNRPSRKDGNWRWRLDEEGIPEPRLDRLGHLLEIYGRKKERE